MEGGGHHQPYEQKLFHSHLTTAAASQQLTVNKGKVLFLFLRNFELKLTSSLLYFVDIRPSERFIGLPGPHLESNSHNLSADIKAGT